IILFSLAAVFSKENGALIPVYLLLIEWLVFRGTFAANHRTTWRFICALLIALPLLIGTIGFALLWNRFSGGDAGLNYTINERLASQAVIVFQYISWILLPRLSDLSLFHDGVPVLNWGQTIAWLALLGHILLLVFAFLIRRRLPIAAFGIGFFYAAHLMESTIIPLEFVFEHRNYLALWGLLLAVVEFVRYSFVRFSAYQSHNAGESPPIDIAKAGVVFAAVFIAILSFMTFQRTAIWSEKNEIVALAVQNQPQSVRAKSLWASVLSRQGRYIDAIDHLQSSSEQHPDQTGLSLQRIVYKCLYDPDNAIKENDLESLRLKISNTLPDEYVANALGLLHTAVRDQTCAWFAGDELDDFISAALINAESTVERALLEVRGKVHLDNGRLQAAVDDFGQVYQARRTKLRTQMRMLSNINYIFTLHCDVEQAEATLDMMRQLDKSYKVNGVREIDIAETNINACRAALKAQVASN
ncbi:MAG: hypothetical protein HKM24_02955, partial [Gammaproteobacteria bacterium]|nr:hypothetical protein [Gammaproteobacteria bacterium]